MPLQLDGNGDPEYVAAKAVPGYADPTDAIVDRLNVLILIELIVNKGPIKAALLGGGPPP